MVVHTRQQLGGAHQSRAAGINHIIPRFLLSYCRKRSKCYWRLVSHQLHQIKRLHLSSGSSHMMEVKQVGNWTQEQHPRAEFKVKSIVIEFGNNSQVAGRNQAQQLTLIIILPKNPLSRNSVGW